MVGSMAELVAPYRAEIEAAHQEACDASWATYERDMAAAQLRYEKAEARFDREKSKAEEAYIRRGRALAVERNRKLGELGVTG